MYCYYAELILCFPLVAVAKLFFFIEHKTFIEYVLLVGQMTIIIFKTYSVITVKYTVTTAKNTWCRFLLCILLILVLVTSILDVAVKNESNSINHFNLAIFRSYT